MATYTHNKSAITYTHKYKRLPAFNSDLLNLGAAKLLFHNTIQYTHSIVLQQNWKNTSMKTTQLFGNIERQN